MATATGFARGPEIRRFLQNIPGAFRKEAKATFGGVTAGTPAGGLERQKALTKQTVRAAPILSDQDLTQLGELSGRLSRVAPQREAKDIANLAFQARAAAGGDIEKLNTPGFRRAVGILTKGGVGLERAAALTTQGAIAGNRPSTLANLFGKLGGEFDAEKVGQKFAEADVGQRLSLLFQDKELRGKVLSKTQAAKFGQIDQANVQSLRASLVAAQEKGAIGQALAGAKKTDPLFFRERKAATTEEKAKLKFERQERALQASQDQFRSRAIREGAGPLDLALIGFGEFVEDTARDVFGNPKTSVDSRFNRATQQALRRPGQSTTGFARQQNLVQRDVEEAGLADDGTVTAAELRGRAQSIEETPSIAVGDAETTVSLLERIADRLDSIDGKTPRGNQRRNPPAASGVDSRNQ